MIRMDPSLDAKVSRVSREYRLIFGEIPDVRAAVLTSGEAVIVVCGWLRLYPSDYQPRWAVRVVLPQGDPWYKRHDCLRRKDGVEIELPTFEEALTYLYQLEAHRRTHLARESWA